MWNLVAGVNRPRQINQMSDEKEASLPRLPKGKRQGSKSPTPKPSTASSTKSRSVSPSDRRRRRPVPHTPQQQRILVPDRGEFTPRRPSSIFGPKTGRWYPRTVSPDMGMEKIRQGSDEEWECGGSRRRCSPCCECRKCCHSRSMPRWESPCGRHHCGHPSPRYHSPSPPRRLWSRGQEPPHSYHTHQPIHQPIHQPNPSAQPPHSILRSEEKPASFVVLTDKVEINNNRLHGGGLGDVGRGGGGVNCCKEQKWMPPWYEPPM